MGLVWVLVSAGLLILAAACLLNFPYIPLFFGLHGATGKSLRGRILTKALNVFPLLALVCVGLGWLLSPLAFVLPFVWLAGVWVLRPRFGPELTSRFANQAQNRQQLLRALAYELSLQTGEEVSGSYLLCTLQCPSAAVARNICALIAHLAQQKPPTIKPFPEDTLCEVSIRLNSLDEAALIAIIDEVNQCAWSNRSIVASISILRD